MSAPNDRAISDRQLRIGIGKLSRLGPQPWYVTIYNRALTHDSAQGWFATHAEAVMYADRLIAARRAGIPAKVVL